MAKKPTKFIDIRSHDFLRVAAISPVVHLADPRKCGEELLKWVRQAYAEGAQVIVAPELNMNGGYTIQDLHHDQSIHAETDQAIASFLKKTKQIQAVISFGSSIVIGGLLFNAMYVTLRGEVLGIVIKTAPPNAGEFTEGRWHRPASELPQNTIFKFGQEILVGNDLLFCSQDNPLLILAGEICQDTWLPIRPATFLALQGATVIMSCHSSNYLEGKHKWRLHLAERSGDDITGFIYAGSGEGESSTSLVFDNPLIIADRGVIIANAPQFQVGGAMVITDINLGAIVNDRMRDNSWGLNARMYKGVHPARRIYFEGVLGNPNEEVYRTFLREFDPEPFIPKTDDEKLQMFRARVMSFRRRLQHLPQNLRKIILGLSGGKDSASVLMISMAVIEEFGDELGMTSQDIHCLTMPGYGTSQETYDFAMNLADTLGISLKEVSIKDLAKQLFTILGHPNLDEEVDNLPSNSTLSLVFENVQVFSREMVLLSESQAVGGIQLGSTSASEALIGWFTVGGDGFSHFAPNLGVGKSAVKAELEFLADTKYADNQKLAQLLQAIARSVSSPELLNLSAGGEVVQKSEVINGPDSVRDFFSYYLLRFHNRPSTIFRLALHAYQDVHEPAKLYAWLERFIRRLATNWYKLNIQSIDSVKVGVVSPSSHDIAKLPSDFKPTVWLRELATVPKEYRS